MRVARDFYRERPESWEVVANLDYLDPGSGECREVDLFAAWMCINWAMAWEFMLVIECKDTSNPWVVLKGSSPFPGNSFSPFIQDYPLFEPAGPVTTNAKFPLKICKTQYALSKVIRDRCPVYPAPGYSIAEGFKSGSGKDVAFNALQQVVSAAEYFAGPAELGPPENPEDIDVVVCAPVLVTTSRIFEAKLEQKSGDLNLLEVERSSVMMPRPSRSSLTVTVVNVDHLHTVIRDCETLQIAVEEFMLNFDPALLDDK